MTVIVQAVQCESFSEELKTERRATESNKPQTVPKSSKLHRLVPLVDINGVLRVGGRLRRATLEFGERHPVLMPNNQPWVRVDLEPSSHLTFWLRLGAPNRYHSLRVRRDICRAWQPSTHTRTARNAYGGGDRHRQRSPYICPTNRRR